MRDIEISDWTKLGSTVRAERRRAGLTQTELATRADTARSWIARIEAGHRGAELEPILRLLRALDLQLILRSEEPTDDSSELNADPSASGTTGELARETELLEAIGTALLDTFTEQATSRRDSWQGSYRMGTDLTRDSHVDRVRAERGDSQDEQ